MEPRIEQKQIIIQDLLLTYYLSSPPTQINKTLLFLHGWRSNSTLWYPILPPLKNEYQMYLLDLPGFGKSQTQKRAFTVQDYATIVREFIQKLDIQNLTIIGHSFGGKTSIKLLVQHPELAEKLVLVDSAGVRITTLSMKLKNLGAKLLRPLFTFSFMKPLRVKIYTMLGSDDYVSRTEIIDTYLNTIKEELTDIMPQLLTRTLLIWGTKDDATPLRDAEIMKQLIPNAQLVTIESAGHFSFLDKPKEFTENLLKFLKE